MAIPVSSRPLRSVPIPAFPTPSISSFEWSNAPSSPQSPYTVSGVQRFTYSVVNSHTIRGNLTLARNGIVVASNISPSAGSYSLAPPSRTYDGAETIVWRLSGVAVNNQPFSRELSVFVRWGPTPLVFTRGEEYQIINPNIMPSIFNDTDRTQPIAVQRGQRWRINTPRTIQTSLPALYFFSGLPTRSSDVYVANIFGSVGSFNPPPYSGFNNREITIRSGVTYMGLNVGDETRSLSPRAVIQRLS